VVVKLRTPQEEEYLSAVREQVLEELNVKELALAAEGDMPAGYQMAEEGGYAVAVDTTITPELADEGLARELVRRIQNLRRAADFELTDRIITYYTGGERVRRVMRSLSDYIQQETLSEELREGEPDEGAYQEEQRPLEGERMSLAVKRA
jgi:isoleucyl-tRNA synthetase